MKGSVTAKFRRVHRRKANGIGGDERVKKVRQKLSGFRESAPDTGHNGGHYNYGQTN